VRPFLIVLSSPIFDYHSNFHESVEEFCVVKDILGVTVRANWRITFRFEEGYALDVNLEGTIEKENAMKASSRRAKTGRR
jgi:hypothetical protein